MDLPQLGRRGEGWVALQAALIVAIATSGKLGPAWPKPARRLRLAVAVCSALSGLGLFAGGAGGLGRQLTPFPKPVDEGEIKRGGAYALVRHPIYGGVLLMALAWALMTSPVAIAPWTTAAIFLDAKRRREEAWLAEAHPEYEGYRREVRKAFVPFLW